MLFARAQELEQLTGTEADDGEEDISMMVLPDYSSGNNEKDIHVKNFNINVGGLELLDCADLKLAYGRKVCLVLLASSGERKSSHGSVRLVSFALFCSLFLVFFVLLCSTLLLLLLLLCVLSVFGAGVSIFAT